MEQKIDQVRVHGAGTGAARHRRFPHGTQPGALRESGGDAGHGGAGIDQRVEVSDLDVRT
ncbi:MAG: hypothetical protein O7B27_05110 [Gammaproteobacteria bacterium]|nr:hypothetical protein [Gammaproteobacteria bacterium]